MTLYIPESSCSAVTVSKAFNSSSTSLVTILTSKPLDLF